MAARNDSEILRPMNARKLHEAAQIVFIGAPRLWISDIGEPFKKSGYVRHAVIIKIRNSNNQEKV